MNKLLYAASAAVMALAMSPAAHATVYNVPLTFDTDTYTAGYSAKVTTGGFFSDSFIFSPVTADSFADVSLTNVGSGVKHITFSKITLDGIDLLPFLSGSNVLSISGLFLNSTLHTLIVEGNGGGNASYGGNVNFTLAPIPEPATWALMVAGVAAVGVAMRRRATNVRIAFS